MLSLLLLACTDVVTGLAPPCVPDAPVPEVTTVTPGTTLRVAAHPLLEDYDTAVFFGATPAEVLGVERAGCEAYDACVADEGCSACGDCDDCGVDLLTCVETVRVRVPALAEGDHALVVWSQYGESLPATVTVAGDTAAP